MQAAVRLQRKIPVIPKPDERKCDASCADSGSQFNIRPSVEQVGFNIVYFPTNYKSLILITDNLLAAPFSDLAD